MGGTYLILNLSKPKEVQIPNLTNLTFEEAEKKAKELKLNIEKEEKYHLEIEEGKIIEQDPIYQENYHVKEGFTIKVVVSKGQEIVKVPSKLKGKNRDEAIKLLKDAGLEVEVKEENHDEIPKDTVIKKETVDGKEIEDEEEIPAGTTIVIYVSMGIEQVPVPDLNGKTEEEAKSAISKAKLKWKSTDKISDSTKPNGVVTNQSITSGSMVDKNTEITITLNEFDEIKEGTITVDLEKILGPYKDEKDEEGKVIKPEEITIALLLDDEIYESKPAKESDKNVKFTVKIPSSNSKKGKIQIQSKKGFKTEPFTYNAGENIVVPK